MTRAVMRNPLARAEWLLASLIDRALHHWGHVPPLDDGLADSRGDWKQKNSDRNSSQAACAVPSLERSRNDGSAHDQYVEVPSLSEVQHTRREGEECRGDQVARVGGMPSFQVASQHGRRNGVG